MVDAYAFWAIVIFAAVGWLGVILLSLPDEWLARWLGDK